MTVDVVRADTNAVAVLGGANEALERLGAWVQAARHAHELVAPLVDTPFVPDNYRPRVDPRATPEEKRAAYEVAVATATAAVLQGITLGLDPMTSLQQIYIVHGRPGMYAKLMVALVQGHGHEVWTEDQTDTRVVVAGRRRGSQNIERVTVTMDQAKRAGWTAKNENYAKTPQDMLWARAASRVCDRIASDVLKGITSVEQVQDELSTPAAGGTRTVQPRHRATVTPGAAAEPPLEEASPALPAAQPARAAQPAAVDTEPPLDDDDWPTTPAPAEPATKNQLTKLAVAFKQTGIEDRTVRLGVASSIANRSMENRLTSATELTKAEASAVIDALGKAATNPDPIGYLADLLELSREDLAGDAEEGSDG